MFWDDSAGGVTWLEPTNGLSIDGTTLVPAREVLAANRTYYVRTDGSDSNAGLANTSGGAWLTLNKAWDFICANIDLAGYTVTVQLADGTYTNGLSLNKPTSGGGTVIFQGNSGTISAVLVNVSGGDCVLGTAASGSIVIVKYMKLTGANGIKSDDPLCDIRFDQIDFGACTNAQIWANGGRILGVVNGSYSITGSAASHIQVTSAGSYSARGMTITVTGTPNFSYYFAFAATNSSLINDFSSYSGSATGTRYYAMLNAVIYTNGGATFFPGNVAGSVDTASGGQYA
jgi:hypothetical protein